jgi:biotin synthase
MKDVNIAAATALQALKPDGRELGLKAGANIIMPNITDLEYRGAYQLYDDKPCLDENSDQCKNCLTNRIISAGETVGFGEWGDSPHFFKRTRTAKPRRRNTTTETVFHQGALKIEK